jgi:hypothetical protein
MESEGISAHTQFVQTATDANRIIDVYCPDLEHNLLMRSNRAEH